MNALPNFEVMGDCKNFSFNDQKFYTFGIYHFLFLKKLKHILKASTTAVPDEQYFRNASVRTGDTVKCFI